MIAKGESTKSFLEEADHIQYWENPEEGARFIACIRRAWQKAGVEGNEELSRAVVTVVDSAADAVSGAYHYYDDTHVIQQCLSTIGSDKKLF